jgi:predicted transcriptional regulator
MKNRDRLEILSLILQVANGGNNATTTKIMNRALLGYKQMKEHLLFLTERDLLYYDKESGTFRTSEKGMRFLQIYGRMEDMIRLQEQKQQERLWRKHQNNYSCGRRGLQICDEGNDNNNFINLTA